MSVTAKMLEPLKQVSTATLTTAIRDNVLYMKPLLLRYEAGYRPVRAIMRQRRPTSQIEGRRRSFLQA